MLPGVMGGLGGSLRSVGPLTAASASPGTPDGSTSGAGASGPVTSSPCTATPSGGGPTYSYSWSRISGSSAISADSASSATTTFSGIVTTGATINAVFKCTVSDGFDTVDTNIVSVALTRSSNLSASVDDATINGFSGDTPSSGPVTSDPCTAVASGGTGSNSFLWTYVSGSVDIYPNSPTSAATTFTANDVTSASFPTGKSATWKCQVSDGVTSVFTDNASIQLIYLDIG